MVNQSEFVDKLLENLYTWNPYTAGFKIELVKLLTLHEVRPKQTLYVAGSHISSVWFSANCWLAQYQTYASGLEEVCQIFGPGEPITDIQSFFLGKEATSKTVVLEGSHLIQLSKSSFTKLKPHPETSELAQHFMLLKSEHASWRIELLALSDKDKIMRFAEKYPLNILPAHVTASYLRIDPSRFSTLRGNHNKSS